MHYLDTLTTRPLLPVDINPNSWQAKNLLTWLPMIAPGSRTVFDLSGNQRHATFDSTNVPEWAVDDGQPCVQFGRTALSKLNLTDPFGAAFTDCTLWIRLRNQANTGSGSFGDISADVTLNSHYPFSNDNNNFYFNALRAARVGPFGINSPGQNYNDNHFHPLAIKTTPGANGWAAWFRNQRFTQQTGDATVTVTGSRWFLGYSASSQTWKGLVSDLRIYNRALSDYEILELAKPGAYYDLYQQVNPRTWFLPGAGTAPVGGQANQIIIVG